MLRVLLGLLPLIAFYGVESLYGLRAGVIAAMVLSVADLGVRWTWTRRIDRMVLFSAALVLGLGGLSLASDDERFVLWTPVLGDVVFAAVLLMGLRLKDSLLEVAAAEQDPELELGPEQRRLLRGITVRFAGNLLLHACLCAWATTQPRETWLLVSGPVQYGMFGLQFLLEIGLARWGEGPIDTDCLPPGDGPS